MRYFEIDTVYDISQCLKGNMMIGSFEDLILAINKGVLAVDQATYCEYLESFGWKDGELGCFFNPGNFCITPSTKDEELPPWFTDKLIEIINAFAAKGAYGSIAAILRSIRMCLPYEEACSLLLTKIQADRQSTTPSLTPAAYNYLYLACVYTDLVAVWKYLLTENLADLNYQAGTIKVGAIHYAIKYSSHKGLLEFLDFAQGSGKFNPNIQDCWGTTALYLAANGLYFNKSLSMTAKLEEMARLLELGANVFLLTYPETHGNSHNRSVLSEVWRVANQCGAETLLLQYGAGLVKPEYRGLQEQGCYISADMIAAQERKLPGFNRKLYLESDVVLIGKDKTSGTLVWFYGVDQVCAALRNPNIEIYREQIARQLQIADPQILGSGRLLKEFLPLANRPSDTAAPALGPSQDTTQATSEYSCTIC